MWAALSLQHEGACNACGGMYKGFGQATNFGGETARPVLPSFRALDSVSLLPLQVRESIADMIPGMYKLLVFVIKDQVANPIAHSPPSS